MYEILIGGIYNEVDFDRFQELQDTYAIIFEDGDWVLNHRRKNFTFNEVRRLVDLQGDAFGPIPV